MTQSGAIEYMTAAGGLTQPEAEDVFAFYVRTKVLRWNPHDHYTLSHGAYFDVDNLRKMANRNSRT